MTSFFPAWIIFFFHTTQNEPIPYESVDHFVDKPVDKETIANWKILRLIQCFRRLLNGIVNIWGNI